jgi:hypothetical protein
VQRKKVSDYFPLREIKSLSGPRLFTARVGQRGGWCNLKKLDKGPIGHGLLVSGHVSAPQVLFSLYSGGEVGTEESSE